jgi:hypothetical protein
MATSAGTATFNARLETPPNKNSENSQVPVVFCLCWCWCCSKIQKLIVRSCIFLGGVLGSWAALRASGLFGASRAASPLLPATLKCCVLGSVRCWELIGFNGYQLCTALQAVHYCYEAIAQSCEPLSLSLFRISSKVARGHVEFLHNNCRAVRHPSI